MPEYKTISLDDTALFHYASIVSEVLMDHCRQRCDDCFYYSVTVDLEELKGILCGIIDQHGIRINSILAKPSCANEKISAEDPNEIASINIFYPDARHTVSYIFPKLQQSIYYPKFNGVISQVEVYRRSLPRTNLYAEIAAAKSSILVPPD